MKGLHSQVKVCGKICKEVSVQANGSQLSTWFFLEWLLTYQQASVQPSAACRLQSSELFDIYLQGDDGGILLVCFHCVDRLVILGISFI